MALAFKVFGIVFIFCTLLGGCVISNSPILATKEGIVESDVQGSYKITYLGDRLSSLKEDELPREFEIFIKGNQYLFVRGDSIKYMGTLHRLTRNSMIAQTRLFGIKGYIYLLIKKMPGGFKLSNLRCERGQGSDTPIGRACEVHARTDLVRLANQTDANFDAGTEDILIANRTK